MVREIFLLRVLKDKNSPFAQDFALHHKRNDLFATLQIVGSIRKNKVKLLRTALQIEKSVCLDGVERANTQLAGRLANEIMVHGVDLDRGDRFGATRTKLIADRAGTSKKVQHVALLDVDEVLQHIEEILLGKVGRRTCSEVLGRVDGAPLECSADYSLCSRLK